MVVMDDEVWVHGHLVPEPYHQHGRLTAAPSGILHEEALEYRMHGWVPQRYGEPPKSLKRGAEDMSVETKCTVTMDERKPGRGGDVTFGGPNWERPVDWAWRAGQGNPPGDIVFQLPDGHEWLRVRPDGSAWHQMGAGGLALDDMGAIRALLLRWASKYEYEACEHLREELDEAEDAAGCHDVANRAIDMLELALQELDLLRAENDRLQTVVWEET